MTRQRIVVSGEIGINQRDDNITWNDSIGSITLDSLKIYLGDYMPASLPRKIYINSHVTGRQLGFEHCAQTDDLSAEYYSARFDNRVIGLWVLCSPKQISHLRARAEQAVRARWQVKLS